jgi:hypothetical protein
MAAQVEQPSPWDPVAIIDDPKGTARIAISAATEEAARSHLPQIGMFIEPTDEQVSEYNEEHSSFQISQIVLEFDTNQADLAKIDGEDVADCSYIGLAQGKGLEIREVPGGWHGQYDEVRQPIMRLAGEQNDDTGRSDG